MPRAAVLAVLVFLASFLQAFSSSRTPDFTEAGSQELGLADLMPSSLFAFGMSVGELEKVIQSRYPTWARSERKRATNNRNDPSLSAKAKTPYLQTLSISHESSAQGIRQSYSFALTSPLSGNRVYSIVYKVEALDGVRGLVPVNTWAAGLFSRWGEKHGGARSETRARATYFFDLDHELIKEGGKICDQIYPSFHRLDEKTIDEVNKLADLVVSTGCAYAKDNIVSLVDALLISSSIFYSVDFASQAADVQRRVVFGED